MNVTTHGPGPVIAARPRCGVRPVFACFVIAVSLLGCAPAVAPPSAQDTGAEVRSPQGKRTITAVVSSPIIGFAPIGLTPMGGNIITYMEVHSNGLVTSDVPRRPIPRLATELPSLDAGTIRILDDGRMTTRWSLRPDVTWHDGTPFTAADVAFGFRVHSDPQLPVSDRNAVSLIESIEVLDPHLLVIWWKRPHYLADSLGPMLLWPLPVHLLDDEYKSGDSDRFLSHPYWTSQYVHTGPFRVARYEPGRETVFEAYDRYFLGRPRVDSIVVREIVDRNANYAAILAGEIDLSIELLDAERAYNIQEQWEGSGEGRLLTHTGATSFLAFQFGPDIVNPRELLDPRLRRALYFALDRTAFTDLIYGGRGTPEAEAKSLLPPSDPLFSYVRDVYASAANNPARSIALFADAGWNRGPDGYLVNHEGRRLPLEIRGTRENEVAAVASIWKQAGVDTSIVVPSPALRQNREYVQSYPGVDLSASGPGDWILNRLYGPNIPTPERGYAGTNRGHYDNPRLTALVEQYRSAVREPERGQRIRQIADIVGEDLPILVTYYNPVFATVRKGVRALDDFQGGRIGGADFGSYTRTAHLWEKEAG